MNTVVKLQQLALLWHRRPFSHVTGAGIREGPGVGKGKGAFKREGGDWVVMDVFALGNWGWNMKKILEWTMLVSEQRWRPTVRTEKWWHRDSRRPDRGQD